jgi:pSer/pThr/pTyr-binding forkhead associated (FHA) protein
MLSTDRPTNPNPAVTRSEALLSNADLAALDLAALELVSLNLDELSLGTDQPEADDAIARADTFVMDEAESRQAEQYYLRKPAPKYIQGVIGKQQIYLITNLCGEGSITLRQPQMVWTLGRNREAGVPIPDRMMSRRHATIIFIEEEHSFYLLDLNSMNGSYVNGIRVEQRQQIQDGDFLRVGNTEFFFFVSQQQETLESLHPEVHNKFMSFARQNVGVEFGEA